MSYLDIENMSELSNGQLQASVDVLTNRISALLPEIGTFNESASWEAKRVCEHLQIVLDEVARRWLAINQERLGGLTASEVLMDLVSIHNDSIQAQVEFERSEHLEVG